MPLHPVTDAGGIFHPHACDVTRFCIGIVPAPAAEAVMAALGFSPQDSFGVTAGVRR